MAYCDNAGHTLPQSADKLKKYKAKKVMQQTEFNAQMNLPYKLIFSES